MFADTKKWSYQRPLGGTGLFRHFRSLDHGSWMKGGNAFVALLIVTPHFPGPLRAAASPERLIRPAMATPVRQDKETLTNQSIISMVAAGLPTDLIIGKINQSDASFDLSAEGLMSLKKANLPDEIIRAMLAKQTGLNPSNASGPAGNDAQPEPSKTFNTSASIPSTSTPAATQFDSAQYFMKRPGKDKAQKIEGTLVFDGGGRRIRFLRHGVRQWEVRYKEVTRLFYERSKKPRYALGLLVTWPLLFTKSKKHFFTVQYKAPDEQGQFAIFRLHKKNYKMILATAEAQIGMKVEREVEK